MIIFFNTYHVRLPFTTQTKPLTLTSHISNKLNVGNGLVEDEEAAFIFLTDSTIQFKKLTRLSLNDSIYINQFKKLTIINSGTASSLGCIYYPFIYAYETQLY